LLGVPEAMRVLHLWDNYAPSLFDQSYDICREEGIEAAVVCMNFIGDEVPPDVRFIRRSSISEPGLFNRIRKRLRRSRDEQAFRKLVGAEIERFQPDVLHVHYGTTGAILVAEPKLLRLPFVVSFYGFDISQGLSDPAIRAAYRAMMKHRPLVHILCDEATRRAIDLGADPGRIVDVNLPLPMESYPYVGVGSSIARWLIPARFVEKKGHEVAFQAFVRHLERYPDHRLTCWGYGDGNRLRDRVRALDLEQSVSVINNDSETSFDEAYLDQLRKHDVVLAPSVRAVRGDDEGGPALTAVLAQIAGKPVILSDFPGSERSVSNGIEGLIVPQYDVAALTAAMARLTDDPDGAREMGISGRERASREFSRNAYRDALVSWYERLANEA
jgi:colanic acid/amylovoran biosynthesis glycosyltransferase